MIVPRGRLLWWVALLGLPLAVLGAASPPAARAGVAVTAIFLLVAGADALMAPARLRGIGLDLPPVVRLALDREGTIDLRVRNDRQRRLRLRIALDLPPRVDGAADDLFADLPDGALHVQVAWRCTGRRRGLHRVERVRVGCASPLGFWSARRVLPAGCELRVYPDLLREKGAAALFLRRGAGGFRAHRQVGKGREFEKLREYIPGDPFEDVHWKATARRGHPVTKTFQIERTQEVYVLIDASRLSARPAGGDPEVATLERFVSAALVLALAAERQGDLFGLVAFSDRIRAFLRARGGARHFDACREAIYGLHPEGGSPDFETVASFVRQRLRKRALLLFLSDLDDPVLAESFTRGIELLRRQHLVLAGMIRPPEARPVFSEGAVATPDDLYPRLAGHLLWRRLEELSRTLRVR
ncbi:MAG: DUF58 domain-containing protein, partial [Candidatus Polarisedimenticolia bacterium]